MGNEKLHELIKERCGTDAAFARKIAWFPQKVYKMLYQGYVPRINEAVTISRALGITMDELASFF